jgi:two-component system phosphate regulon sensor histidine kinase PhoR
MTYWTLALSAAAGAAAAWLVRHYWTRPEQRLAAWVDAVAQDRPPDLKRVLRLPSANQLAASLEKIKTDRRQRDERIRELEFNLQAILSSTVEGVMVVDDQSVIHLVNNEFLELFQLNKSPLRRTVLEALREAAIHRIIQETLASNQKLAREIEITSGRIQVGAKQIEVNTVPIQGEKGQTSGAVVIFHDISRLKQLEGYRRELVANVSHELRTPLSIFRGYIETLIDNPSLPREELIRILNVLKRHSHRLHSIVEDLLALSRLESGHARLDLVSIRPCAFLGQLVEDWKPRLAAKSLEIRSTLPDSLAAVEADPFRLEQVMNNLIDNAIKYSSPGGSILIGAESDAQTITFFVQDNGVGIPPADLPHIFERFYRVEKDRARPQDQGGTGLGLSIVKHIVQLHHGTVRAESEHGKGTRISFSLPLQREPSGSTS